LATRTLLVLEPTKCKSFDSKKHLMLPFKSLTLLHMTNQMEVYLIENLNSM